MELPKLYRVLSFGLTTLYLLLAASAPYAAFHRHDVTFDPSAARETSGDFEYHDATCDAHSKNHYHFSEHCLTCKHLSGKSNFPSSGNFIFINDVSLSLFFLYPHMPLCPVFHAASSGRAPPSFFS